MKDLRLGIIGLGGRSAIAWLAHQPDQGLRLVAAADPDPAACARFRERAGPDAFTTDDHRQLLARAKLDAVFVTSPDFLHEEHAIAALEAGTTVYLEKPIAITIAGADRILATAARCRQKLYLGHNMRHFPVIRKMKALIDGGAIGEPKVGWCRHFISYGGDAYFKDWHCERAKGTGLLLQKGAHDIDILHWLCGGYTQTVTALGGLTLYDRITDRRAPNEPPQISWTNDNWPPLAQKGLNPVIDVEDVSQMLMQLDNGVFASYQQCHYTPDAWRNYTIIGTAGRVENFGDVPGEGVVRLWNKRQGYNPAGNAEFPIPVEDGTHGGADPKIIGEFIRYLREGGATETSPVAARYSVAAGCQATWSLRHGGQPATVPPLDPEIARYFADRSQDNHSA